MIHSVEEAAERRRKIVAEAWKRRRGRPGKPSSSYGGLLSRYSDDDVLIVNRALADLRNVDLRSASLLELRFFGGLSIAEAAEILGYSEEQATEEWVVVRAWLRRELDGDPFETKN